MNFSGATNEGINGWTFDPYLIENIYFGMKAVIVHEEKLLGMGKKSLEIIERYSPKNSAAYLADYIQTVALKRRS